MFGYNSNATSEFPGIEGSLLDFKQTPLSVAYQPIALSLNVSNASICDANGDLLFYCNGCAIANKEHEVMENGDSLNIGEIHNLYCIDGYPAGSQSVLIIPAPDSENIYYVFYKWMQFENPQGLFVTFDTLFLAAVDMSLNNGLGTVLEKNVPIITEKMTAGQLTAVKHANGRDWWILTSADTSNIYLSLLITEDGVLGPFEQTIGMKSSKNGSRGGQAVFSPDGEKYIRYSPQDGVFLFDFDRTQGTLSNFIHLPVENGGLGAGVAVSPNSNFLYVSANDTLYQYNLQSDDINSSSTIVSIYDGYLSPFPTLFHNAQLAPDCKIYINSFATVDVLHVIQNPDEPGLACNVEQHAIQLPFNHRRSLPSFPNYRLGPLVEGEDPPPLASR